MAAEKRREKASRSRRPVLHCLDVRITFKESASEPGFEQEKTMPHKVNAITKDMKKVLTELFPV